MDKIYLKAKYLIKASIGKYTNIQRNYNLRPFIKEICIKAKILAKV